MTASAPRRSARRRELLRNDAFERLRRELGTKGFEELAAQRITTIAGDVGADGLGLSAADRDVLASCDTVLHSAAAVSFDSPLDSAVEINLLGPMRVAQLLQELGVRPHLVSVSTCYVAGNRPRHGARGAGQRRPVRPRPGLADRGRSGPPAARRRRGCQPPARPAGRAAQGCPSRARSCGCAGAGGEDGAAAASAGCATS